MEATVEFFDLDPNIQYVKAYGLQRSGTNYVTHFINENFENVKVLVNLAGWKHGPYAAPWILGQEVHVVAIAKNPYAWLVSLYKYWGPESKINIGPDLDGIAFEEFVTCKVYFEKTKNIPYLLRASNPVQHWNNMYFHWSSIRLVEKQICLISYEKLLADPTGSLDILSKIFGFKAKFETALVCDKILEPSGEDSKLSTESWTGKTYYDNQSYLEYYTPELIEFVNKELDIEMMLQFGYDYIQPEDL